MSEYFYIIITTVATVLMAFLNNKKNDTGSLSPKYRWINIIVVLILIGMTLTLVNKCNEQKNVEDNRLKVDSTFTNTNKIVGYSEAQIDSILVILQSIDKIGEKLTEVEDSMFVSLDQRRESLKELNDLNKKLDRQYRSEWIKLANDTPNIFIATNTIRWMTSDSFNYVLNVKVKNIGKRPAINFDFSTVILFTDHEGRVLDNYVQNSADENLVYIEAGISNSLVISRMKQEKFVNVTENGFVIFNYKCTDEFTDRIIKGTAYFKWDSSHEKHDFSLIRGSLALSNLKNYLNNNELKEKMKIQ